MSRRNDRWQQGRDRQEYLNSIQSGEDLVDQLITRRITPDEAMMVVRFWDTRSASTNYTASWTPIIDLFRPEAVPVMVEEAGQQRSDLLSQSGYQQQLIERYIQQLSRRHEYEQFFRRLDQAVADSGPSGAWTSSDNIPISTYYTSAVGGRMWEETSSTPTPNTSDFIQWLERMTDGGGHVGRCFSENCPFSNANEGTCDALFRGTSPCRTAYKLYKMWQGQQGITQSVTEEDDNIIRRIEVDDE